MIDLLARVFLLGCVVWLVGVIWHFVDDWRCDE